jgi:ATP-dependent Clp protease protease subunit
MVPFVFEKDRSYDVYSKLLKDRIIFLSEDINKEVASSIIAQLILLNIEDPDAEISLYIMSCGGDTIRFIEAPVATYCIGEAASGAALLLASGATGRRFALPSSRIMIHQLRGGVEGTYAEMDIHHEEMKKMESLLVQKLSKITGKSAKTIEKDISNDLFMGPQDAVKYGLVDKVIERKPQ